jgi:hypothetical protein
MKTPDIVYVAVPSSESSQPNLTAFGECAKRAETIEEFRSLILATVAREAPYQILSAGRMAYDLLLKGGHLFKVNRSNG